MKIRLLDTTGAVLVDRDLQGDVTVQLEAAAPPPPAPTPPPPAPTPPPPAPTPPAPPPPNQLGTPVWTSPDGLVQVNLLRQATDGTMPDRTTANQMVALLLGGSGTVLDTVSKGDQYIAYFTGAALTYQPTSLASAPFDDHMYFCVRRSGLIGMIVGVLCRMIDRPGGDMEPFYTGYTDGPGTPFNLIFERRIKAFVYDFIMARYASTASPTKWSCAGDSMGAWAVAFLGLRLPFIGVAMPDRPRWYSSQVAGQISVPDYRDGTLPYPVASAPPLSSFDGGGPSAPHFDMISYVRNPANRVPPTLWDVGRRDGYGPFSEQIDAMDAFDAAERFFCFIWNNGTHEVTVMGPGIEKSYFAAPNPAAAPLKNSDIVFSNAMVDFPYLSGCSLDKDPRVDLEGSRNASFQFMAINVTATLYSVTMRSVGYVPSQETAAQARPVTVTIKPTGSVFQGDRTPKTVTFQPNVVQTVNFP